MYMYTAREDVKGRKKHYRHRKGNTCSIQRERERMYTQPSITIEASKTVMYMYTIKRKRNYSERGQKDIQSSEVYTCTVIRRDN